MAFNIDPPCPASSNRKGCEVLPDARPKLLMYQPYLNFTDDNKSFLKNNILKQQLIISMVD